LGFSMNKYGVVILSEAKDLNCERWRDFAPGDACSYVGIFKKK